ncbi:YkgJ family cysteine cluster protein [Pyxidicoccus xibeiensis]|uniref:YkgJ family cysteine cluster protein n=1 Tax=Pyxidicoccus xibeiensis TaxID=2906759 RepID=UPI0020A7BA0F|nr:hypothetical protein [Pyxidicoccus xibeiensis]MCP3139482.1 hypothetical protein [Pyxidicoccus xibeiensis]
MSRTPPPGSGPFRVFPTQATRQRLPAEAAACGHCLGGTCCQSEDAIYLTAFDVLRLATYFDLSPAEFLRRFTQDRFAEGALEPYRRATLDDPESSVVTYLRRRANRSFSPCIFLKYVRDADGTPRRICGVHPARPLSCREYYHDTCKTRVTGELAALQAHAFERVRDGALTREHAEAERARLGRQLSGDAPMSALLEYSVWTEVWRALRADEANEEGAGGYALADYQDPIDVKLDRMLSKQRLRLEERYGWEPHGDQLQPYRAGLSFVGTEDHRRLLRIAEAPPTHGLFADGDYPFFAANRLVVAGMRPPKRFPLLGEAGTKRLLRDVSGEPLFPRHRDARVRALTQRELWRAALAAADALVAFASYVATLGRVLEQAPPGTFEWELLWFLRRLEVARHPVLALHPGLGAVGDWAREVLKPDGRLRVHLRAAPPPPRVTPRALVRLIDTQAPDGSWWRNPARSVMPDSQEEYLRRWLHTTAAGLLALRPPSRT